MAPKIDEFTLLLIIATVFMVIILLATPFLQPLVPPGVVTKIAEFTVGSVGFVEDRPAKSLPIPHFTIGQLQKENLKSLSSLDLETSLFSSKKEELLINVPRYFFEIMERITLEFTLTETNQYGDLVIKWNGEQVYRDRPGPKDYKIAIPKDKILEQNKLEVYAEGPGLLFWATTVYRIRNFNVNLEYGPAKIYSFELSPGELETFRKGRITFYATGPGTLTIKLNGVPIYSKTPKGLDSAEFNFTTAPLNIGENILAWSVREGVIHIFEPKLEIYLFLDQIVAKRTFEITEAQLAEIKRFKGRIDLEITKINRPGELLVRLNRNTLPAPTPKVGIVNVTFSEKESKAGPNELEVSSTGAFEIGKVTVNIVR